MSSPTDQWMQFYQRQNNHGDGQGSVATTVNSITTTSSNNNQLNPEGRVTKPIRRRSRVSKRTPTTLLNTDTTNFRAMVQQFTGGGGGGSTTIPFSSGASHYYNNDSGVGATNIVNFDQRQPSGITGGLLPEGIGYNFMQQRQQQQQHVFSINNNGGDHIDHNFFHGLVGGGANPSNPSIDVYDGFDSESVSSQVPSRSYSSSNRFNDNPYRY